MITVQVLDSGKLERIEHLLKDVPNGLERALYNAGKRATSHMRQKETEAMKKRYAIGAGEIKSRETVTVTYSAGGGGLQVTISYAGSRIPLSKFSGASGGGRMSARVPVHGSNGWRMMHPSNPARGHVLVSTSPYRFHDAFMPGGFKSGHSGIFERTGGATSSGRDELRELTSPSVPQMIGHEEVGEPLLDETAEKFEERLNHEILRLLGM